MNAISPEFQHLVAAFIVGTCSVCTAISGWLIKRAVSKYDDLEKKTDKNASDISWIKGVIEAAGIVVTPIGPGIGGRS
jgi:hypothetical protein